LRKEKRKRTLYAAAATTYLCYSCVHHGDFFASRSMPCCGLLRLAVFAAAFGLMMLLLTAYLVPGIIPAGTVVYVAPGFLDSYLLCI